MLDKDIAIEEISVYDVSIGRHEISELSEHPQSRIEVGRSTGCTLKRGSPAMRASSG